MLLCTDVRQRMQPATLIRKKKDSDQNDGHFREFPQCLCLILTWNLSIHNCRFLQLTAVTERDISPLRTPHYDTRYTIHVAYPIQFKKVCELCTEQ